LNLAGKLGRIKDHFYAVMVSGVVELVSDQLEAILGEVHGGQVYRRRRVVGGKGGGGKILCYGVVTVG